MGCKDVYDLSPISIFERLPIVEREEVILQMSKTLLELTVSDPDLSDRNLMDEIASRHAVAVSDAAYVLSRNGL